MLQKSIRVINTNISTKTRKLLEENLGNYSTDPKLGKDCKTGLQKVWWWWFSH